MTIGCSNKRDHLCHSWPRHSSAADVAALGKSVLEKERDFNARAGFTAQEARLPRYLSREKLPPDDVTFDVPEAELGRVVTWGAENHYVLSCRGESRLRCYPSACRCGEFNQDRLSGRPTSQRARISTYHGNGVHILHPLPALVARSYQPERKAVPFRQNNIINPVGKKHLITGHFIKGKFPGLFTETL